MPIALPSIAAGDLRDASLAEVVAAVFQARATGTLWVELEGQEGRVYFRYGVPCGARMPAEAGFQPLGVVLLDVGWLTPDQHEKSIDEMNARGKRHGEVLVELGFLSAEQLQQALRLQHHRNLVSLMMRDEGRYEFRGYERPPSWTEAIALDSCRAVVDALADPQMERQVAKILASLEEFGGRARVSPQFPEMAGRFDLDAAERRAVAVLQKPLGPEGFAAAANIPTARARALMASLLLLGAAEPDEPETAPAPSAVAAVFAAETPAEALPEARILDEAEEQAEEEAALPDAVEVSPASAADPIEAMMRAAEAEAVAEPAPAAEPEPRPAPAVAEPEPEPEKRVAFHAEPSPSPQPAPRPAPVEKLHVDRDRSAVRARLLARAFKNVPSAIADRMSGKVSAPAPQAPEPAPAAPAPAAGPRSASGVLTEEQRRFADEIRARAKGIAKEDYFTRLGLAQGANVAMAKEAFLKLAKVYHPDRIAGTGLEALIADKIKEVFGAINEAYETLADDKRRDAYIKSKGATASKKQLQDEAKLCFQRGEVFMKKRAWQEAAGQYQRACDLDPLPLYYAALAWVNIMDPAKGEAGQKRAHELIDSALTDKDHPSDRAFYVAGVLARTIEDFARAEKMFRKTLELNPNHIEATRELRLVEKRRAEKEAGKKQSLFDKFKGR